jgi:flagellar protein FlbD
MVELTALNGQKMVINENLIERIESRPDTIVSLTSGRKLIVRESVREMLDMVAVCHRAMMEDVFNWSLVQDDPHHELIPETA